MGRAVKLRPAAAPNVDNSEAGVSPAGAAAVLPGGSVEPASGLAADELAAVPSMSLEDCTPGYITMYIVRVM